MSQVTSLGIKRYFTNPGQLAYSKLDWIKRDANITNAFTGQQVFSQKDVEFPEDWSQNAINIVAQKYFCGTPGSADREYSLKQLVDRVADTITQYGYQEGYFEDSEEQEAFREELKYILASQRASFNSPVWFNIGVSSRAQQASACFILSVDDTMDDILNWYVEEGRVFKGGSGAGVNLSKIRSSYEKLSNSGGTASGPHSFMRGADSSAGAIKSGGKTRRAAKMVILNDSHPDIEYFINCKAIEERKARVLKEAGFDMDLDGRDSFSVQYQNANNSVRATDEFMNAVTSNADWSLKAVTTGETVKTLPARELMRQIAQAAWECADPGMQFDTTINQWHTTPNAGRIEASNPCSEYMHLNNSACNLASINLLKYLMTDGTFDIEAFKHTVDVLITAQEILVGYSVYPTDKITKTAKAYRELGLGYANLGALLMAKGIPYDSDEGRALAGTITALMTGESYAASARISRRVGPFAGYNKDRQGMLRVIDLHARELSKINAGLVSEELLTSAAKSWDDAVELSAQFGVRNSQVTLLAPTGTIGFMMDCDTTGIEPDLGLVKTKKLVGGGTMSIVNQTVPMALMNLGYTAEQVKVITDYIDTEKTIIGAPGIRQEHYPIFACSMGDNVIHYSGHVKMMAAVQPFLSGAISKTVNMPEEVTVDDVENLYIDSWKMGLKAVAIYRDNCKVGQPLSMTKKEEPNSDVDPKPEVISTTELSNFIVKGAVLRELPSVRNARTFSFHVADAHGYVTVGEYDDGTPGELFINIAKQGSTMAGLMDAFAISISHGLQYGVPLKSYVKSFSNMSFAPAGITDDSEIRTASSIVDYIFRRLALSYLTFDDRLELGLADINELNKNQMTLIDDKKPTVSSEIQVNNTQSNVLSTEEHTTGYRTVGKSAVTAPLCFNCGNITQRAGSCYVCNSCGTTSGCS